MTKKSRFILLACLLATACIAADESVVPDGITYKKTTDAINDSARRKVERMTGNPTAAEIEALSGKFIFCCPGLWQQIKNEPAMAQLPGGRVAVEVPALNGNGVPDRIERLDAKVFQTADEVLVFWKVLAAGNYIKDAKIRKLTTEEMRHYWAMIPYDIPEPVFVAENKAHRILLQFDSDDLTIMWVEDLQKMASPPRPPATMPVDSKRDDDNTLKTHAAFDVQFKWVADAIARAGDPILYEGLPRATWDPDAFQKELRDKKTIRFDEYPFYDVPLVLPKENAKKLVDLCRDPRNFVLFEGKKLCGGFHPDWCVKFTDGSDVYFVLICLTCQEAHIHGPTFELTSDLDKGAEEKFLAIVNGLGKNRPGPTTRKFDW